MGPVHDSNGRGLPYQTVEYKDDDELPFAPDGKSPLIHNCVERVIGTSGPFVGLKCVRKTVIAFVESDANLKRFEKRRMVQEAKILHMAQHQHVVKLFHTYFEEGGDDQIKFAFIMDRADGSLQQYLKPSKTPSVEWYGCLISVIHHIHSLGIRHRDVKPSNILIKAGKILLADFGISQMGLGKTMPTTYQDRNPSRSREYCAPEVDKGSTRGRSADMFSLGAVFLEMLIAGNCPNQFQELDAILKPPGQQVSSYARHADKVREWIQEKWRLEGWQRSVLLWCHGMLDPERARRPLAEELDTAVSRMSTTSTPVRCQCVGDLAPNTTTKLIDACKQGLSEEMKRLICTGGDPNTIGAIHFAAERGSRLSVQALLEAGAFVDSRNPVEQTALHCAARAGFQDVVEQLLERGANVNAKDENDYTALHGAAAHGFQSIVAILLRYGADTEAEDLDGQTAAQFAERRRHYDIVRLLQRHRRESGAGDIMEQS